MFILNILKSALKNKSGMNKLTSAVLSFDAEKNKVLLQCEGFKDEKTSKFQGELENDSDVDNLRIMFVKSAGKIPGKVTFVKIVIDYINSSQDCKVYYIDEQTNNKLFKSFTI